MSRWTDESNPNLLWMVQNLERFPWWCQKNKKNYPHPWGDHPIWRAYIWGWFNHQPAPFGISCFVSLDFTHFDSNPTNSSCSFGVLGSIYFARRQDRFGTSECPEMMGKAWKTQSCYLPFFSNPAGGFPISPRDPFKGPWIIKGFFHHHHFEWRMDATKRTCGQWSDIHLNGLLTKRDKNIVKKLAPKKLDHFIYYTLY